MAGDWIKVESTLPDKPEVIKMASILRIDQDCVTGKLIRVWTWANQNSVDGNAIGVTPIFLDRLTSCPGFSDALRKVGWLQVSDGVLSFPKFLRHNGQSAKARALTNRRVATHRGKSNVNETPPSLPNPLPEKRREKIENMKDTPHPPIVNGGGMEVVESIYQLFPKKLNRIRALDAIGKALTKVDPKTLRSAIVTYAKSDEAKLENGRFIPSPDKWFKQESWKDWLPKLTPPVLEIPRPSKALEDARAVLRLNSTPPSDQRVLAAKFIGHLVPSDIDFLTEVERTFVAECRPSLLVESV